VSAFKFLPGGDQSKAFGAPAGFLVGHVQQEVELFDIEVRLVQALGEDARQLFASEDVVGIVLEFIDTGIGHLEGAA